MSNRGGKGSLVVSSGSVVAFSTVLDTVAVFTVVVTVVISTRWEEDSVVVFAGDEVVCTVARVAVISIVVGGVEMSTRGGKGSVVVSSVTTFVSVLLDTEVVFRVVGTVVVLSRGGKVSAVVSTNAFVVSIMEDLAVKFTSGGLVVTSGDVCSVETSRREWKGAVEVFKLEGLVVVFVVFVSVPVPTVVGRVVVFTPVESAVEFSSTIGGRTVLSIGLSRVDVFTDGLVVAVVFPKRERAIGFTVVLTVAASVVTSS